MARVPATTATPAVPVRRLRRMALSAQGLLGRAAFGRGRSGTLKAIEQLGYVQIDTISVVVRAHHHVLATRVPNYHPRHLEALLRRREVFEYWYHAAAYLPMRDYRFALPRMQGFRDGTERWVRCTDQTLMREVLARVRSEGPLRARDFEHPEGKRAGWWDWKPAKRALEQLFMQGDLMVAGREGFEKTYDLAERILPPDVDTRFPDDAEMAAHLLANALRAHGFVTQPVIAYLRRSPGIRAALKSLLADAVAAGRLALIHDPGGTRAWADPERLESRTPPAPRQARVLSPFDNAVIHRKRVQSLFDFDYQIECYLPAHQRRYGYFCLPLLYRDRLVGRADCKAHRDEGRFRVRHLYLEDDAPDEEVFPALAAAFARLAALDACAEITLDQATPKRLTNTARQALATCCRV